MEINAEIIKDLIKAVSASGIGGFRLETNEFKLAIRGTQRIAQPVQAAAPAARAVTVQPEAAAPETPAGTVVTSPIVGTYYASASPDKAPFVKPGQQVKKGDTLFIVESMKLMNEIASECDGTVAEIYAENGKGVEYGQPILRIE